MLVGAVTESNIDENVTNERQIIIVPHRKYTSEKTGAQSDNGSIGAHGVMCATSNMQFRARADTRSVNYAWRIPPVGSTAQGGGGGSGEPPSAIIVFSLEWLLTAALTGSKITPAKARASSR